MCGIGGVFNKSKDKSVEPQILVNMAAIQSHRGPDGFGYKLSDDASVGFCHARPVSYTHLTLPTMIRV